MPRHFFSLQFSLLAMQAALLAACFAPDIAGAALGEPETSIQGDVSKFQGTVNSSEHLNYRVHEISLPSGTVLREFVTSNGGVFAVAWRGPTMPNLRQALGKYFDSYVAGAKNTPIKTRHLDIEHSDLVVHAMGHMRSFSGVAYLPQAIPSGVSLGELK